MVLVAVSLIPFGSHVSYKLTSGIEHDLTKDAAIDITHERYGLLNSAVSWPNLAVPLVAGLLVDRRRHVESALFFSGIALIGQLGFAFGVAYESFELALASRAVFGIGEGMVMVVQGAVIAKWFRGGELTFAIGITEMTHAAGNWLGKVAVNVGIILGGWKLTPWVGVAACTISVACSVSLFPLEATMRPPQCDVVKLEAKVGHSKLSEFAHSVRSACQATSLTFWLLIALHVLISNTEHLFDSVSANFIRDKWGLDVKDAAWLSSVNVILPALLSPAVGLILDRSSWRMLTASLACATMAAAHVLLGLLELTPWLGLLMLSGAASFLPTILRSCVPLVVPLHAVAFAFGLYSVGENAGKTIGSPLVGYIKDHNGSYTVDSIIFVIMSSAGAALCLVISAIDHKRGGKLNANASKFNAFEQSEILVPNYENLYTQAPSSTV